MKRNKFVKKFGLHPDAESYRIYYKNRRDNPTVHILSHEIIVDNASDRVAIINYTGKKFNMVLIKKSNIFAYDYNKFDDNSFQLSFNIQMHNIEHPNYLIKFRKIVKGWYDFDDIKGMLCSVFGKIIEDNKAKEIAN